MSSTAICVSQEGPANALALNKDCTQVVIAGRNVFKVFSIGESEFTEVCNLRVGKNLNLNFSSIDVAWSGLEEQTLATAATNGAVVVWNLGRSGRSKQEHVFSDHKRTVNKVSFHLTEPNLLISGSQDGMMKCFDLRMKEVARTFISNTESIRDVQFSPHTPHVFSAVSENGAVQAWDVRRHERPLAHFTAHSGPVFACDWHPTLHWLATASRDKTIKVWDMQSKPTLEHTIYTIASVGHVKWRPQKKHQVASCALVLDSSVHVWDVRRPHVPLATFAEHRDVTTAIAWQASPDAFLATSRDCSLYRHRWSEAAHPVLWANPQGVCVSARGEVASAVPLSPLPLAATEPTGQPEPPYAHAHDRLALGRKQPRAGSLSATAQAALERAFPTGAASKLGRFARIASAGATAGTGTGGDATCPVIACARLYRMHGAAPHVLADHNATVARDHDRHMVAHVWDVVKLVYALRAAGDTGGSEGETGRRSPARRNAPSQVDAMVQPPQALYSATEEEGLCLGLVDDEVEEWAETQFHNSGVLGKPTHAIYIPPAKFARRRDPDDGEDDENDGWVSAASAHYVDVEATDWTLPEEAFPLRTAPQPQGAGALPPPGAPRPHALFDDKLDLSGTLARLEVSPGASSPASSGDPPPATASATALPSGDAFSYSQQSSVNAGSEGSAGETNTLQIRESNASTGTNSVPGVGVTAGLSLSRTGAFDAAPHLAAALKHHADLGDVQTAAVVMIVLQEHRSDLFPYIDESLQEQWLLGYIELLQRHKMWNRATEVIRCAWLGSVWALSQQSTGVALACGRCGRRTRPHAPCERCQPRHVPDACSVCHKVVRGLYAWCQGCSHGGHLSHMQQWMALHQLCPAGCGHLCQLG